MNTILRTAVVIAVLGGSARAAPRIIEGRFGRVEVDTERPALAALTLRRADGSLEPQSLLSPKDAVWLWGVAGWATQALTYAADEAGQRFESRNRAPEAAEVTTAGVRLRGVLLTAGAGEPVAREEWTVECRDDDLVWTVERTWLRELVTTSTGTPALFFSMRPIVEAPTTTLPNSVATTFWVAPEDLRGWFNPSYRHWPFWFKFSLENNTVVTAPGGWAVLKLFTAWPHESEPRFAVEGGHLYRRGLFAWIGEAGIVSHAEATRAYAVGDKEQTTLRLSAVPAAASGHQLAVTATDPSGTIDALRGFYGALLNGGCVNDPLHYTFGNEPDGWYYGGASWMKGLPLLAGAPAPEPSASRPHSLPHAFRDNLQMILGTEFAPGRTRFGYNCISGGAYTDDNIIQVIGGRAYYLYSGDLAFVRQHLPFYRRAVAWYLAQRNADGLVSLTPAHWYYDAMGASGVTTYHNAFLYRALLDLAGLERAAGNAEKAVASDSEARQLQAAINRVLWWEEAPGGPRYVDWITPDGTKIAYAADLCQFPPVAFGIASPEQGKKLIATIDRRIGELEREHGYLGLASRSAYWPVPDSVNVPPQNQGFGTYMNGGSFLCMTYWEIMARTAVGDAEGAWNRLRRFAEGTRLTGERGFIGENWVMADGRLGAAAGREPFLSDMIAVPAALVQGILGIRHTDRGLEVNPVLPAVLQQVSAEVVHLGRRQRVTIVGKEVTITDLGVAFTPPPELTWRADAGKPPETELYIDRTFEVGSDWTATPEISLRRGQGVTLKRRSTSPLAGLWKLDEAPRSMVDRSSSYEAARLQALTGAPTLVSDVIADSSEHAAHGRRIGDLGLQSLDRQGRPAAARFQGGAHIVVDTLEPFTFKPGESFTVQAWFQTSALGNQVIAARPGAYSLGVKAGRLSAWIMQDGSQFVEAVGAIPVATGQWHHAAAVYDRSAQVLTLYLDGQVDGVPPSLAGIGASGSTSPLTLGAFGGGLYTFDGALDEISIQRRALAPGELSFGADYPPPAPPGLGALSGRYTTAPCDWGQAVALSALATTVTLHDGAIAATVELSNDDFATLAATHTLNLPAGRARVALADLPPSRQTRVVFALSTPAGAERSPVLAAVELTATPSRPLTPPAPGAP